MFYTFTRRWWKDRAETVPNSGGRKHWTGARYQTEQEARDACGRYNATLTGGKTAHRGPYGHAMEYTRRGNA